MRGSRLPALAVILGMVVLTVVVVISVDPIDAPTLTRSPNSAASATPHRTVAPETTFVDLEATGGGPDFALGSARGPTGEVSQSKLWFHDGAWWGILLADGSDEFRIRRFDWASRRWLDTGTRVAQRASTHPDVLTEGNKLWVATGGGPPIPRGTIALFRYTYDPDAVRYVPDPDFPVTIADQQSRALTLARDDAGRLWAAWISDERLVVSHTEGNDLEWGESYVPPVPGMDAATDAAALVSYGETVMLLWTTQEFDAVSLAAPSVDIERWEHSTVVVEGLRPSDDDVNVSVLETPAGPRLFAALRTSLDALPDSGPGDPQVVLLVVEADGSSRQYLVGRVEDDHTRPIVLLDGENEVVYVVATRSGDDDAIYLKASAIADISFASGAGAPIVDVDGLVALDNATSTKQTLDSSTGLMILASDAEAGRYAWAAGRLPGPGSPDLASPSETPPVDDPLMSHTFDSFTVGAPLDPMWIARPTGGASFAIADTADGRRVAAASAPDGSHVRMCRRIVPTAAGRVRIEAEVMVSRTGTSDVTVTAARHDGDETAVVRLDDRGVFSFFDGSELVRSEVRFATGVWYTSTVELDLAGRTYDWRVQRSSDGVTVFAADAARWRAPATGPVTEICFESADTPGPAISFAVDRVRVEH